ncbi:MAG: HdeD family acid-resistance protein [Bacteroidales bacterium]
MSENKFKRWRIAYGNGMLAIILGLIAVFIPEITVVALAIYFAIAMLLGGTLLTISSIVSRKDLLNWPLMMTEGVLGILIGLIILFQPENVAAVFVVIIGIWALIIGIVFLFSYFRFEYKGLIKPLLISYSILSILVGLLLIFNPFEGTRIIVFLIGIYAIVYGIMSIMYNAQKYVR